MEGCFVERCVALNIAKLSRFPAIFFRIKRRVERKCVDVVMRIGDAVDGPCFGVNKARVDQVPRGTLPVTYLPICPFPRTRVSIRFSMSTIVSLNASWISCSTVLSPVSARYNDTDFGTEKQKS